MAYYSELLDRVRAVPEWKDFMVRCTFMQTTMQGVSFVNWLDRAESFHRVLMREAKLMAPRAGAPITDSTSPNK